MGTALCIIIDVPIMGGNPRTHWNFWFLVEEIDALEIKWLSTGKFRMEFRLNGLFTEFR